MAGLKGQKLKNPRLNDQAILKKVAELIDKENRVYDNKFFRRKSNSNQIIKKRKKNKFSSKIYLGYNCHHQGTLQNRLHHHE